MLTARETTPIDFSKVYFDPANETFDEFRRRHQFLSRFNPRGTGFSPYKGRLLAERLPTDAWDKWCNDDVVCFGMNAFDVLKIYFANPRDLSVYFVADFSYMDHILPGNKCVDMVSYALVGSKIHVIGNFHDYYGGRRSTYYCDVANPNQRRTDDGSIRWEFGPELNCYKRRPCVFSLAGNLYALSMRFAGCDKPFEVLKSGCSTWQVLPSPFPQMSDDHVVLGSFVIDDDDNHKFLVYSFHGGETFLSVFDAEREIWIIRLTVSDLKVPVAKNLDWVCAANNLDLDWLIGKSKSFALCSFSPDFEHDIVDMFLGQGVMRDLLGGDCNDSNDIDEQWHLLPLTSQSGKLCLLVLYGDHKEDKSYVRVGTFDLVHHRVSDDIKLTSDEPESSDAKPKRYKVGGFEVANVKFRTTELLRGMPLGPLTPCGGCPEQRLSRNYALIAPRAGPAQNMSLGLA